MTSLLEVEGLAVRLADERPLLSSVSLRLAAGEALGLVGESGSGKSMTARAIVRRLPDGARAEGSIRFAGQEVLTMEPAALRGYRRTDVAMIFQEPRAAINPVRTVGDYLREGLRNGRGLGRKEADAEAVRLLDAVGIDRSAHRLRQHPHEISGGMLQRVMIAGALGSGAKLILADEPTTALDVSIQAEVVALLDQLRREHDLALLFITHDLDLAVAICDRIDVMYAGSVLESRSSTALHDAPLHPYTAALIACRPSIDGPRANLAPIPGVPVSAAEAPAGCVFSDRCAFAVDQCLAVRPELTPMGGGQVRCHRSAELAERLKPISEVPS
ncbi:MAG: ABC transporter ATP-binding protein [Actinobacteria bacterium]|nr:ABC transporter ATP-binding protein [Actinomycetota bacterium]